MSARHRISTAVRQSPVDVEARLRPIVDTAPGAAAALHWRCALLGSGTVSTADAAAALLARTQPGYDYELEQLRAALARVDSE